MIRTRRPRRRYDQEPPRRVIVRGLVVLAGLAVFLWLGASSYNGVPGRDYRYVDAVVPQLGSLISHDPVRIGGVRVGQVASIHAAPRGEARLNLQLEPGTSVPQGTAIRIRANGLLGARFVELVPAEGNPPLAAGASLRGNANTLTYNVTDALDVFDRETRHALHPMLGDLAGGFAGQGAHVNDLLRIGAGNITQVSDLFRYLRYDAAGPVQRLFPAIQRGNLPFDASRNELAASFAAGATALAPFVTERAATRSALDEAPTALAAADTGLQAGRPLLSAARALSAEVRRTLPAAPGGLRAASALLVEARRPLERAQPLLRAVGTAVPAVLSLTRSADPLLRPARSLFDDLDAIVRVLGPYGCNLTNFAAVFRSMTGMGNRGPGGPNGPAMQFRLQSVSPLPTEAAGMKDATGVMKREAVPAPCRYLSTPYTIIDKPQSLGKAR